jgi:transposase
LTRRTGMREDIVEMTKRELGRWQLIQKVLRGELTQALAGEAMGLSERQVRRLVKKVKRRGARGLAHESRGKESPRKMAEEMEDRIAEIIRARYPDFSPLHAAEKLAERHRIEVSREKVRQVMMAKGLWKRRRFRKEAHFWRERKHRLGEMVQMDGSHHDWLEGRGGRGWCSWVTWMTPRGASTAVFTTMKGSTRLWTACGAISSSTGFP